MEHACGERKSALSLERQIELPIEAERDMQIFVTSDNADLEPLVALVRVASPSSGLEQAMRGKRDKVNAYLARRAGKRANIAESYKPLDEALASLPLSDVLSEELQAALASGGAALRQLAADEAAFGVKSLPFFKESFAKRLIREVEHIEANHSDIVERPNSMNNYGLVLQEYALFDLFTRVVREALQPLARAVLPEFMLDFEFDSQHVFVVEYAIEKDKDLANHMDESLVTANVNLGKTFAGGAVSFQGVRQTPSEQRARVPLQQRLGGREALIHPGQTWHSAEALESGERFNLIIWARSFASLASPTELWHCRCNETFPRQLCHIGQADNHADNSVIFRSEL